MLHTLYTDTLLVMALLAVIVFIALYRVRAGYGLFVSRRWGPTLPNRLAWVLMEAPVLAAVAVPWIAAGCPTALPAALALALFTLHYAQRSFLFPLLIRGRGRMPWAIVAMGLTFNAVNGLLIGTSLFLLPPQGYAQGAAYLLRPAALLGLALFALGMAANLHSDHVIRHLRRPGDTRHYLPARGLYRLVTSANYLGELTEWTGFALLTATPAAWLFVAWTAANLVPRAAAIHQRYRQEFGDAVGRRKRIIPYIY